MRSEQNRNEAFASIVDNLPKRRQYVFNLIKGNENITTQKLSEISLKPINEISPRITELKGSFLIIESGSIENIYTQKKNTTYRAVMDIEERKDLIDAAYQILIDKMKTLEVDALKCVSKHTQGLIRKEILKTKNRISHLGQVSILNDNSRC